MRVKRFFDLEKPLEAPEDPNICTQGTCWPGYIYLGPRPGVKGSCSKPEKIPKKHKCHGKVHVKVGQRGGAIRQRGGAKKKGPNQKSSGNGYDECLATATKRHAKGDLKLCPRGYCTAKHKFEVFPSAYANGYATQVCQGTKPDFLGEEMTDQEYAARVRRLEEESEGPSDLQRWYQEAWVNVCEKGDGPGGFAPCGTGQGIDDPENYPYCRAYYRLPGTPVVTAQELSQEEIDMMCERKRSLPQGVEGKPTRVVLPKSVRARMDKHRQTQKGGRKQKEQKGGSSLVPIPDDVREAARIGLDLMEAGFKGGTQTGWDRAEQLAEAPGVDTDTLATMRAWFARHGPDAKSGGTSYPGYCEWLTRGQPMEPGEGGVGANGLRGAVAWLIWGGDPAYLWLKTPEIRELLRREYPDRKEASAENNLGC